MIHVISKGCYRQLLEQVDQKKSLIKDYIHFWGSQQSSVSFRSPKKKNSFVEWTKMTGTIQLISLIHYDKTKKS